MKQPHGVMFLTMSLRGGVGTPWQGAAPGLNLNPLMPGAYLVTDLS